jgi:hypothetical protein
VSSFIKAQAGGSRVVHGVKEAGQWLFEPIVLSHKAVDDPIGIELLDTYLASYGVVHSIKTKVFQPSFQWYIICRGETRG